MDTFPDLDAAIEEIGFLLESFDFTKHNDEGNPRQIELAQAALLALEAAIGDLVP